jgi:superfamily II DNA or RNA helicase
MQAIIPWLLENGAVKQADISYSPVDACTSQCYELDHCQVIIDHEICDFTNPVFNYDLYTEFQNRIVAEGKPVYRFLDDVVFTDFNPWVSAPFELSEFSGKGWDRSLYVSDATPLEHFFENRFTEVYGSDALRYLQKEYPLVALNGANLYLDYVVEYIDGSKTAVEENGVNYHHPQLIGRERYLHQLEKQNICAALGIRLFRFSSQDCRFPDHVDDQIQRFFGDRKTFRMMGIIAQRPVTLYKHQAEALAEIRKRREQAGDSSVTILTVLPTATGKSKIIEEDIARYLTSNPQARILIVGPSVRIMHDWLDRISHVFYGTEITYGTGIDSQIQIGTYHTLWALRNKVSPTQFAYIVVDEAHHAVAPMLKLSLQYFAPQFLIGITATPDRLDSKKLEEVFGSYRTTLDLPQAIEKGIVAQVRAFRVETNLNLSEIRFNGHEYVNADLERTIHIDSRNRLIVSVVEKYFTEGQARGMKGIVFCVNISHAEAVAELLGQAEIAAAAVSSKTKNVEQIVQAFREGRIRFLCSCNMLSEGWDVPEVGVLVMARPTLSKVLYLQQLGRGLRKTAEKQELFVIDVVDQYGAVARPWTTNAVFNNPYYVPFGLLSKAYQPGDIVDVLGLAETVRAIVPIDIQTFESQYAGYLQLEQAARSLYIGTMTLQSWVTNKTVAPDLVIPFGSRKLLYFKEETIVAIREKKGLKSHTDDSIKEDFLEFLKDKTYTFSFKIVFMQALLASCDRNGEAPIHEVLQLYRAFYKKRLDANLPVDKENCVYTLDYLSNETVLQRSMLDNPFEKYERKRFVYYGKDVSMLAFNPTLWHKLTAADKQAINEILQSNLEEYYQKYGGL